MELRTPVGISPLFAQPRLQVLNNVDTWIRSEFVLTVEFLDKLGALVANNIHGFEFVADCFH